MSSKNILSKYKHVGVLSFIIFIFGFTDLSASPTENFFKEGTAAFENDDYVSAVKNLHAYFELTKHTNSSQVNSDLIQAINYSEDRLYYALKVKDELDKHGKITVVTVESSGKADNHSSSKTCYTPKPERKTYKPKLKLSSSSSNIERNKKNTINKTVAKNEQLYKEKYFALKVKNKNMFDKSRGFMKKQREELTNIKRRLSNCSKRLRSYKEGS